MVDLIEAVGVADGPSEFEQSGASATNGLADAQKKDGQKEDGQEEDEQWGVLARIGRALHVKEAGLEPTLHAILQTALDVIEPASAAGVNLLIDGRFEPQTVLGAAPHRIDAWQQRTGQGPCIDASRDQRVIVVPDTADDAFWPGFGALAEEQGVRSMLCAPLWVDAHRLGSVSLYADHRAAFGSRDLRMVELVTTQAALALSDAFRTAQLRTMAHNRDVIGQAKGILVERHRITPDAAFGLLREASQRANRKLLAVCEDLVTTGVLGEISAKH